MIITFLIQEAADSDFTPEKRVHYFGILNRTRDIKVSLPFIPTLGMLIDLNLFSEEYSFTEEEQEAIEDLVPEVDLIWVVGKEEFRIGISIK